MSGVAGAGNPGSFPSGPLAGLSVNEQLMEEFRRWVPRGVAVTVPVFVARAHGACITDVEGREYIDLASGIGVLNVGSTPEPVVRAIKEQAERFLHTCVQVMPYELYIDVARRLAELTPGSFPKKAALFNSGAEAVENAIKISRSYRKAPVVISFEHAFHGRTYMSLSLTSRANPYKRGFGPFVADVYRAPFPYLYRRPAGVSEQECIAQALDGLRHLILNEVGPDNVAAVIVEPVIGEGGFLPCPPDFYRGVAELCRRHGIVLIADEIQTGWGRTGRLFASEHYGVEPDLVVVSKSLAAGLPLSAVVGRAEIMDAPQPGGIGGTFGGNPVACAAALAVMDMVAAPAFIARAAEVGDRLRRRLERWAEQFHLIGDVRGLGAMVAMELVRDRSTKEPAAEETQRVLSLCHANGVVVLKAGTYQNVVRFLPPLTISDELLDRGLDIVEKALAEAAGT